MRWAALALAALLAGCPVQKQAPVRVEAPPAPKVHGLVNVQRTFRLLASSSPAQRNTVRVLFYGQSITQSGWSRTVARELRRRYPHARLEIANRAIGGFSSEHLVKAAESDLYSYYPDLVIFHVYGSHYEYEDIVRNLRERTTAELMLQTDHVVDDAELDEETDPALLAPSEAIFSAFINHAFLPKIAARYDATLCDVRGAWKRFLQQRKLPASALLSDHVHLNAAGDELMAELMLGCLRHAPDLGTSPLERSVETLVITPQQWQAGRLRVPFRGNRVDAVLRGAGAANVLIDGKRPSEWSELYSFTRASVNGAVWPPLYGLSSAALPRVERWTARVVRAKGEPLHYRFHLTGEITGPDGSGDTLHPFVSYSQRVLIEPNDWNIEYAFELAGITPVPPRFSIVFTVQRHGTDVAQAASGRAEQEITLAQGLPNGEHLLVLEATTDQTPVVALRVYRPPGDPSQPRVFGSRPLP